MGAFRAVYIAYPSSLQLKSANALQTFHTARALRALDPTASVLIPRLPFRASAFAAIGATHLPRLPFNVFNRFVRTTLWSYLERTWFAWLCAAWLLTSRRTGRQTVLYMRDAVGAAWFGLLFKHLLRVRLVYEVHDLEQWNPSRARSSTGLVRLVDSAAVRGADRVVALTDEFRRYLVSVRLKPAAAVGVIPDAYDDAVFIPRPREVARTTLGIPAGAFVACYSGFTFAYRRLEALVAAWDTVRTVLPHAQLYLVGGRPTEVAALAQQAEALALGAAIQFVVVQPPAVVADYLAAADVLVIPGTVSGRNASPLKMFEYMAMRRPIVSVDLDSLREILGDDGALFVPTGDSLALSNAIVSIAREPERAAALAEAAGQRSAGYSYAARAAAVLAEMGRAAGVTVAR